MPTEPDTAKKARRGRTLARTVVTQVCIVFATIVGLELFLRAVDLREVRLLPESRRLPYQHDAEIGWVPVASKVIGDGERFNSIGLRDIEPAATGGPTILFIGDSFVYGLGVRRDERFTERLREQLPGFRIVNAGVAGYGTDQAYLLMKRLWPTVAPSIVVLIVCVENDHDDNSTNVQHAQLKPYLVNDNGEWRFRGQPVPRYHSWYYYNHWLANRSALVRLAIKSYMFVRYPRMRLPDPTAQLVKMIRDHAESQGAKLLVGLQYQDRLLEPSLVSWNIPYTRLGDAETLPNDSHWSPQGHATVARRLTALFAAEKVLEAAARRP